MKKKLQMILSYPQYFDGIGAFNGTQRFALGALPVVKAACCHSATDLIFGPVVLDSSGLFEELALFSDERDGLPAAACCDSCDFRASAASATGIVFEGYWCGCCDG